MQHHEKHLSSPHVFVMQGFFFFFFLSPDVKESMFIFLLSMSSLIPGLRIRKRNFSSSLPREKTGSFKERNTESTVHLKEWLSQK